ncbi:hypothetical protein ALC60_08659 [Trachymyrmex zeteki]|uniref:Uncharacterized protein n=2 Tax=Attini TaxID=143999 RepID=A0A195ATU2_9HYME|nr:hypothetical protein ALC53_13711 [Atta colombica]KYQ52045.1 hypothetical protein ALC60_08659 [Trachymyrmex zeteki]
MWSYRPGYMSSTNVCRVYTIIMMFIETMLQSNDIKVPLLASLMLCQVAEEERVEVHAHVPIRHLLRFSACRSCRIHLSCAETLLVLMDLSRRVALLFQMYSLSKDIYDK